MRIITLAMALALPLAAQETADLSLVDRIKSEAFDRSKVMDHLYNLTDVHGPRLTGSPEYRQAAKWALERLKEYGLVNVHPEAWGPFGRSWSAKQYSVELLEPRYSQLNAAPLAWSSSTEGPVTGDLVLAPLRISFRDGLQKGDEALTAFEKKWAGKLRGKIVLLSNPKVPREQSNAQFRRYAAPTLPICPKRPPRWKRSRSRTSINLSGRTIRKRFKRYS